MKKWARKKIKELSQEYKYNFFLRIAIETYLEGSLICFLNIRHYKLENMHQIVSLTLSVFILALYLIFTIWTFFYSLYLYKKYGGHDKIDLDSVRSMFGEYKMKNYGHAMFNSLFVLRRLSYAFIIVFLPEFPIIQIFLFTMS